MGPHGASSFAVRRGGATIRHGVRTRACSRRAGADHRPREVVRCDARFRLPGERRHRRRRIASLQRASRARPPKRPRRRDHRVRSGPARARSAGETGPFDRHLLGLAATAALVHAIGRTRRPQGACGQCRRVRAGGGQMVQPRSRLWFRQAAGRLGRRGRVRAHGNGADRASARAAARPVAGGADRAERQGPDRDRAARLRRVASDCRALCGLLACSPQAPAQNAPAEAADPRRPDRASRSAADDPLQDRRSTVSRSRSRRPPSSRSGA